MNAPSQPSDSTEFVSFEILRQASPADRPRWQAFRVPYKKGANVISCLMAIQRHPVDAEGMPTTPVAWDSNCLEEVCGACTMVINGRVRQSCSALVDRLTWPIRLEPMRKFPVVRDLAVDRSRVFRDFKRVGAWIPIDGTHDLGPGPRISAEQQEMRYLLSTCMACGCCLDACPQYGEQSEFIGAAPINQVRLFNAHPTGKLHAPARLESLLGAGGIQCCGKAGNCVQVCPKGIPLTTSIAQVNRELTGHLFRSWLTRDRGQGGEREQDGERY